MQRLVSLVSCLLVLGSLAGRGSGDEETNDPVALARASLARGDHDAAMVALAASLATAPTSEAIELGVAALVAKGDLAAASSLAENSLPTLGDSTAKTRASFVRARLLAALGKREEALAAARIAVDGLQDPARRFALASHWLDLAQGRLEPPPGSSPSERAAFRPDFESALHELDAALETETLGARTVDARLDRLRCLTGLHLSGTTRRDAAKSILQQEGLTAEQRQRALEELAVAFVDGGDLLRAMATARDLQSIPDARERAIRSFAAIAGASSDRSTIRLRMEATANLVSLGAPPEVLETAHRALAAIYAADPSWIDLAILELEAARAARPTSPSAAEIEIEIANLRANRDGPEGALPRLETILVGRAFDDVARKVAEKIEALHVARIEFRDRMLGNARGEDLVEARRGAIAARRAFIGKYPANDRVPARLLEISRLEHALGEFEAAVATRDALRTSFPNRDEALWAVVEQARDLAERNFDFAGALALVESVDESSGAHGAGQTLRASILDPTLQFLPTPVVRSAAPVALKLRCRNVGDAQLSVYRVDLRDFFLATGHFDVLDTLDVALITADRTFTLSGAAGDETSHRESTREIALESMTPGQAAIVAARSGDRETRAFVFCSDLDVVIVRTADELRAIGVDGKTGTTKEIALRVAQGGRLLPKDGAITRELAPRSLEILAIAGNDLAVVETSSNAPQRVARAPAGSLVLDRSDARPGEVVRFCGFAQDETRARAAKDVRCVITAIADTRTVRDEFDVLVRENGRFAGEWVPTSALGKSDGTVDLEFALTTAGASPIERIVLATANLRVGEWPRSHRAIHFEPIGAPPRPGSPAKLTVRITDPDGIVRPRAAVSWSLNHGDERTTHTDDAGRFVVAIDVDDTRDRDHVVVSVSSAGEEATHLLELRSGDARLEIERGAIPETCIAGDPIELSLHLVSDGSLPVSTRITVELARRPVGERDVLSTNELTTDASGRATLSMVAPDAGAYELRLTHPGAFGLPRDLVLPFEVLAPDGTGVAEPTLISDRNATPGADYALRVISPLDRSRALIAVIGSKLEHTEVVTLEKGVNRIVVPIPREPLPYLEVRLIGLDRLFGCFEILAISQPLALTIAAPERVETGRDPIEATLTLEHSEPGTSLGAFAFVAEDAVADRIERRLAEGRSGRILELPTTVATLQSSAAFEPGVDHSVVDELIEQTLAEMSEVEKADAPVLVDALRLEEMIRRRKLSEGGGTFRGPGDAKDRRSGGGGGGPTTGGGGASHGGRSGGRSSRFVRDEAPYAVVENLTFGADSTATWRIPAPPHPGRYRVVAFAVDAAGELAIASHSFLHDPARVGTLAIANEAAGDSRAAHLVISHRRDEATTVALSVIGSDPNTPEILARRVELEPFCATSLRVELPIGATRGTFRCGPGLDLDFSIPTPASGIDEMVISRGRPLTIPAARRAAIGTTGILAHASPITMLDFLASANSSSDGEATEWRAFAAAEALRMASAISGSPEHHAARSELASRARALLRTLRIELATDASRGKGASDRSALVLLALDAMHDAKVADDPSWFEPLLDSAVARVESESVRAKDADRRALPLWVLARTGRASYEKLNRLARDADSLEPRGLALLALALAESDHPDEATAVRSKLVARLAAGDDALRTNAPASEPLSSPREIAALIALAAPGDSNVRALEESWLSAIPLADPSGAAPLALLALAERAGSKPTLTRKAASGEARIEFVGADAIAIASLDLAPTASDSGDVALDPGESVLITRIPGAAARNAEPSSLRATRSFLRITAKRDGKEVVVGASMLGSHARESRSVVDRLGIGRGYSVEIEIELDPDTRSFWWFEPTLPGVEIIESSLPTTRPSVPTTTGRWFLFDEIGESARSVRLRYNVLAIAPGSFTAPSSAVRAHRASESKIVESGHVSYSIEPGDIDATFEPTPNEAIAMGLVATKEGRHVDAVARLGAQLDALTDETTNPTTRTEALRALLDSSLAAASDAEIVRIFEIAKEQDPDRVLGFDAMDRVARAYAAIGEWERSRFVFSAIGDALFLQESRIVGRLEGASRDRLAVDVIERLLAEHDVTSVTLETAFALGQHATERARSAKSVLPKDDPGLPRAAWREVGRRSLERFLAFAPDDPACEEVSLTLANLLLDLGDELEAERLANAAARRFATGRFNATWPYVEAFAALSRRDLDATIAHAERLVAAARASKDPIQRRLETTGQHMLAQAYHAKGDLATARPLYEAIRDQVSDARLVLAQLDRSAFTAPPIVTCGASADLVIPLDRKGLVGDVEVSLYPVDLRLLYLKRRGFDDLADLELAGVNPGRRAVVTPTRDDSTLEERLTIAAPGKGAYVVFLRCGDLNCRLVAITSDLSIETTLLPHGARILAVDRSTGAPKSDVVVTFVGSDDERFVTKKTDLRGIAAAEGLAGRLAVIAQLDGNYAFFQGDDELVASSSNAAIEQSEEVEFDAGKNEAYDQLEAQRLRNDDVWKANTNRAQQGVEIRRTKK